jgi:hypothetical protein
MTARHAVLTPYPIPAALRGKKVENVGDGFILRAIERLVGPFASDRTFSPRVPLEPPQIAVLEASDVVVLAGANQLHDRWTVWPGLTAERLRASRLRLVPFGVGLHGEPGFTDRLSDATRDVLTAMHERIALSSWRCPHTVAWLRAELPALADRFVMTGCPVVYDAPLLDGTPFSRRADHVAVTVTERGDFAEREQAVLDAVARRYPRARRSLVLHQNWSPPTRRELLRHRFWPLPDTKLDPWQRLRKHAIRRGYRVVAPRDADSALAFYDGVDVHVGSRLHAHLLCLSRARRSWLIPVDGRATGIAEHLGFPLCDWRELDRALDADVDFERVRANARAGHAEMLRFVATLPR